MPSLIVLPLALWSAVPGIRWCPLGWAEVRPECFATCAVATESPLAPPASLEVGTEGCCERSCAAAAESCPIETPGESDAASEPEYPGGRAYCLGEPTGGDGVSPAAPPEPDASSPAAVPPIAALLAFLPTPEARPVPRVAARPPAPPGGAVPRTRAPPLTRTTIG